MMTRARRRTAAAIFSPSQSVFFAGRAAFGTADQSANTASAARKYQRSLPIPAAAAAKRSSLTSRTPRTSRARVRTRI
jgi:hypothetical protein